MAGRGREGKTFSILALGDVAVFLRSAIRRVPPSNRTPGAKERGSGTSRLEVFGALASPLGVGLRREGGARGARGKRPRRDLAGGGPDESPGGRAGEGGGGEAATPGEPLQAAAAAPRVRPGRGAGARPRSPESRGGGGGGGGGESAPQQPPPATRAGSAQRPRSRARRCLLLDGGSGGAGTRWAAELWDPFERPR